MPSRWWNFEVWLHGLFAAFIGGGASGVTAGLSAIGIAPDTFNFAGGLRHTLELVGIVFFVNGLTSALFFLKQSPLPALDAAQGQAPQPKP